MKNYLGADEPFHAAAVPDCDTLPARARQTPAAPCGQGGFAGGFEPAAVALADTAAGEVDVELLQDLLQGLGPDGFAEAIMRFLVDAQATRALLVGEPAAASDTDLRRAAHRLKGLFLQYGAAQAGAVAAEAEEAPANQLGHAVARLYRVCAIATEAVQQASLGVMPGQWEGA